MSNIDEALRALYAERSERQRALDAVELAINAIKGLTPNGPAVEHVASVASTPVSAIPEVANGSTRSAILELLTNNPGLVFNGDEVTEVLLDGGWTSSSSSPRRIVASTLSSMVRNGTIEKVGTSGYRAFSDSESEREERLQRQLLHESERADADAEAEAEAEAREQAMVDQYEQRSGR